MKKLAIFSMTLLFTLAVVHGQTVKTEKAIIKETKKEIKTEKDEKLNVQETKEELKTERKALRKLEGETVSEQSKNSFYADFGNVPNAQWKRAETFDEVTFTKDGKEMKAFYDFDRKLVGTTTKKTFADLPAKGQKEIKEKYADYTVGQVFLFDDNEANESDMIFYGTQFDDEDNYFVELKKGTNNIVLRINPEGNVAFFKQL